VVLIIVGCKLPDLQPFSEATAQLHEGMTVSQTVFHQQVMAVAPEAREELKKLDAEWKKRIVAMEALVNYAEALAGIAEAGRSGRESAKALGGALNPLFNTMQVSGLAGTEAFAVATELYDLVAQAAAADSLSKAVDRAHPAIRGVTNILARDMNDLIGTLMTAEQPALDDLEKPFEDRIENRDKLIERRDELVKDLAEANAEESEVRKGLIKQRQALLDKLAEDWDAHHATLVPQIEQIDKILVNEDQKAVLSRELQRINGAIEATREWHTSLETESKRITSEFRNRIEMMTAIRDGFVQLEKTHKGIGQALRENRRPNIRVLINTVIEIKTIINERNVK
jgi:hypothetical protein